MRRAAKIDNNQPEIVQGMRDAGISVQPMHGVGGGFPDLLWWHRGLYGLIEVKDENGRSTAKYRDERCLTPAQKAFHEVWPGFIDICWTLEEAIEVVRSRTGAGQ